MTLVRSTNDWPARRDERGSSITRGSTRGTLTIVTVLRRPKASLPASRATKLSDLLATCGNGCDGSRPTGTRSGRTWVSKKRATQRRSCSSRSAWLRMRIPSAASAGITSSLKTAYCASISSCAAAAIDAMSAAVTPLLGLSEASRQSAKRTSKNSSRLEETMQT